MDDAYRMETARRFEYWLKDMMLRNHFHGMKPASISDVAIMCGVTRQAISKAFDTGAVSTIHRVMTKLGVGVAELKPVPAPLMVEISEDAQAKLARVRRPGPQRKRLKIRKVAADIRPAPRT